MQLTVIPDAIEELDQLDADEAVKDALTIPGAGQDSSLTKRRKVLRGNRLRHFGSTRDIPYAGLAAAQKVDDAQPNRVRRDSNQRSSKLKLLEVEEFGPSHLNILLSLCSDITRPKKIHVI